MRNVRNVRDAIPLMMRRSAVDAFALRVAEGLRFAPGAPLRPVFDKLGGTFIDVASTFGRRGDRILVGGTDNFSCEGVTHFHGVGDFGPDPFVLAECLGALFMHYPIARGRYGDDVAVAIPYITPEGTAWAVTRELIWFASGLLMPAAAFREAFAIDPDLDSLATRFRVDQDNALARCRSLDLVPRPEAQVQVQVQAA